MQPHRRRKSSATPFLPPPGKPKDISLIDNVDELLGLLRRTNEQLTRCPPTIRETLENRCSKIEARLEHVNSMKKVATDLRDTHITQPPVSDDMSDVSMDDAVLVPPPPSDGLGHNTITVDTGIVANHQPEHSSPILDGQATVMSTKAKIFTMPVVPQPVNKANPRGVRMIDDQTSLRIQQEEMSRRREHQRAQQEARVEKERKIIAHTEEAAARVVAASHSENDVRQPYQEDMERRAGIIAFMNYRPDSDDEDDDDSEDELDDEAMEALLEAEFEDGIKGQAIFDPDGLEDLIRVDPDHLMDVHMAQGP